MKEISQNIWLGQTALGILLALLSYFMVRYARTNDERHEKNEDRMNKIEKEGDEIKKNYIRRFEEVHEKIDDTKEDLKDHFTREIKEVVADKHRYRERTNRELGEISTKIDYIIRNTNNKP